MSTSADAGSRQWPDVSSNAWFASSNVEFLLADLDSVLGRLTRNCGR